MRFEKRRCDIGAPCEVTADHTDKLKENTEFDDFIHLRDSRSDRDKRVELPDEVFNSSKQRVETCLILFFSVRLAPKRFAEFGIEFSKHSDKTAAAAWQVKTDRRSKIR